jgi:hypothetical protein
MIAAPTVTKIMPKILMPFFLWRTSARPVERYHLAVDRRPDVPQSLNDLLRPSQQRWRDREAKRLGGLEVDDEMESVDLLDRQISGVGA